MGQDFSAPLTDEAKPGPSEDHGPSGSAPYRGLAGSTRRKLIHYACTCGVYFPAEVVVGIDASTHPALLEALGRGELNRLVCDVCGTEHQAELPVVLHEPAALRLSLTLPEWARSREVEERIALLELIASDKTVRAPSYLLAPSVSYRKALQPAVAQAKRKANGRNPNANANANEKKTGKTPNGDKRACADVNISPERAGTPERIGPESSGPAAVEVTESDIASAQGSSSSAGSGSAAHPPPLKSSSPPFPINASPHTPRDESGQTGEAAASRISAESASNCFVERGRVRVCWRLPHEALEPIVTAPLAVRIMMHPIGASNSGGEFPLVVLAIVPPIATPMVATALGAPYSDPTEGVLFTPLDVRMAQPREVLIALQSEFRFDLELYETSGQLMARREISAPLEENARFVLARSQEGRGHDYASAPQLGFAEAFRLFMDPGYDRLGSRKHNFAADSFQSLLSPAAVRLAVSVVAYWCEPQNEDYFICVQSFPLSWWRPLRQRVITRAIELGIALPRPLAEQALGEGHAVSQVDLCERLLANFAEVSLRLKENDLDPAAEWDNWRALLTEASHLGFMVDPQLGELARAAARRAQRPAPAEEGGAAYGSEGHATGDDVSMLTSSELHDLLDDPQRSFAAALALSDRPERDLFAADIFRIAEHSPRAEALQLLGRMPRYGVAFEPFLLAGLRSGRSFFRQACALVLGLRNALYAAPQMAEVMVTEPSAVWKEVGRALGSLGPEVIPLMVSWVNGERRGGLGAAELQDRVALVLAHVAAGSPEARASVERLTSHERPELRVIAERALDGQEAAEQWAQAVLGDEGNLEETAVRKVTRGLHAAMAQADVAAWNTGEMGEEVEPFEETPVFAGQSQLALAQRLLADLPDPA